MMNVDAIKFPVLGVAHPKGRRTYVFIARDLLEMQETPLHSKLFGFLDRQRFIDSNGMVFVARNIRLSGIDWKRIREVGVFVSLLTSVLSLFNVPVIINFDLRKEGVADLAQVKKYMKEAINDFPRYYTFSRNKQVIEKKISKAKTIADCFSALG